MKLFAQAVVFALTWALAACDDSAQLEELWRKSISECQGPAPEKDNDPDAIIACMAAAGFEPLGEDEAPDICFGPHVYDTPGCWRRR